MKLNYNFITFQDVSSYVTHYRLQLLVVPKVYQMMHKKNVPAEEPFWSYGGKTRQHQGRIVDSIFNIATKKEALMFYTLGEDRYLVCFCLYLISYLQNTVIATACTF